MCWIYSLFLEKTLPCQLDDGYFAKEMIQWVLLFIKKKGNNDARINKRYFKLGKCCIEIKLSSLHMRQFLIHTRNQWKIF